MKNLKNGKAIGVVLLAGTAAFGGCALSDYTPPTLENTGGAGQGGAGQGGAGQGGAGQGGAGQGGGDQGGAGQGGAGQGGAGQGGGGGMTSGCMQGSTKGCYTGPAGTQGVGECKKGTQTCDNSGTWSECLGAIVPVLEDCKNQVDSNCDGLSDCTGDVQNVLVYSTTGDDDIVLALSVSPPLAEGVEGVVYAAGIKASVGDLNTNQLSAGRVLFTRRTPDGVVYDWADKFGTASPSYAYARGLATLPGATDDVAIVGNFRGTLVANGSSFTSPLTQDGFVAVLGGDGNFRFMKVMPSTGDVTVRDVGADTDGNTYVVGRFVGIADFGGDPLTSDVSGDGFIVSYGPQGEFRWQTVMGGPGVQSVESIDVTQKGNIVIGGVFANQCALGGSAFSSLGGVDFLVADLEPAAGSVNWANAFGGPGDQFLQSVVFGANETVLVSGGFRGTLGMGGSTVTSIDVAPSWDIFVGQMDSNNGDALGLTSFGGPGTQVVYAMAVDAFGDAILAGAFSGALDLKTTTLNTTSESDVNAFAVKATFSPDGILWAKQFGDMAQQAAFAVTTTPAFAHPIVGGGFKGKLTGALSEPTSTGGTDSFVIDLAP